MTYEQQPARAHLLPGPGSGSLEPHAEAHAGVYASPHRVWRDGDHETRDGTRGGTGGEHNQEQNQEHLARELLLAQETLIAVERDLALAKGIARHARSQRAHLKRAQEQIDQLRRDLRQVRLARDQLNQQLRGKDQMIARLRAELSDQEYGPAGAPVVDEQTGGLATGEIDTTDVRAVIRASGLFDEAYYLEHNGDVAELDIDPLDHFLEHGAQEGRKPHPLFDPAYYLAQNPDVAEAGTNPLLHYILTGGSEGRNPSPLFDTAYFLSQLRRVPD